MKVIIIINQFKIRIIFIQQIALMRRVRYKTWISTFSINLFIPITKIRSMYTITSLISLITKISILSKQAIYVLFMNSIRFLILLRMKNKLSFNSDIISNGTNDFYDLAKII